jgi:hypothetical protein
MSFLRQYESADSYAILSVLESEIPTHLCVVSHTQLCPHIRWFIIHGFSYLQFTTSQKTFENERNKRFISFRTHAKREWAVTWWNPAVRTCPVLDSSSFVPIPKFCGVAWVWDKGRWVKYWTHLGCCISPCYGPFSLGACFEIYKPFISLIFKFFLCHGEPWIMNQQIRWHARISMHILSVTLCIFLKV